MDKINQLEREVMRLDLPAFAPGDTVKVHVKIKEGEKERIQVFQGVVISKRRGTTNATFIVRKVSYGVGVERIFPLHSPIIDKIEIVTRGRVRRAKIYYLRKLRFRRLVRLRSDGHLLLPSAYRGQALIEGLTSTAVCRCGTDKPRGKMIGETMCQSRQRQQE